LITFAKGNRGKLTMASAGTGSAQHVYGELFKTMAGVDFLHVPFRGNAPALSALLGGQVSLMFDTISTSMEYVRAGTLRALAVTSLSRVDILPDIPTVSEFVPGYEGIGWQGICAPKNTPSAIIETLNKEVNAGLADQQLKTRIRDFGATVFPGSAGEFGDFIGEYTEKWARVIQAANIKAE
jgi:tripartite-type tricarboxylate transporter receptor subunit TctC